jgi:hypothetical protein
VYVTTATVVLLLLQVPPEGELLSEEDPPTHKLAVPVIDVGLGLTLTVTVVEVEQPFDVATTLYTFAPVAVGVMVFVLHGVQPKPAAPDTPDQVITETVGVTFAVNVLNRP